MSAEARLGASFRDPSGFVYKKSGVLLRQVNESYRDAFRLLTESGLYESLVQGSLLIPHTAASFDLALTEDAAFVIKPEIISTISYPYEWSFSQLKDAALLTLQVQKTAIQHGMSLKDASAYNVQFHHGRPIFLDTLSFEPYLEGKPWIAYRQFCQHFVAPLVLMSHVDVRLGKLSENFIDGIPLDLASRISHPFTRLNVKIGLHLHLHAKLQAKSANEAPKPEPASKFSKNALLGLIDGLSSLVEGLQWKPEGTEWADYYSDTNYSSTSMAAKKEMVKSCLQTIEPAPKIVWDLGANNGEFSAIATGLGIRTVAWDIDPAAVEKNYRSRRDDRLMLPLVQDLTNPSPDLGWGLKERDSFIGRGPVDAVMALALVHHLAISNNVPLQDVAEFMARIGEWLIIEFVPKEDSQVQRLLATREDVFPSYTKAGFESAFSAHFRIVSSENVEGTVRTLYLMRRIGAPKI